MSVVINEKEFNETLANEGKAVFIDFFSNTCIPCKMMAPVFETAEEKYSDKAVFAKVDTASEMPLAIKYSITAVPCIIGFKNGQEIDRLLGACSETDFYDFVESVING